MHEILTNFHCQILWELLFLDLWAGELGWGWDPSLFRGDPQCCGIPPGVQLLLVGLGSAHFASLPLLPVSSWLLFHILSYRDSIQLVFR